MDMYKNIANSHQTIQEGVVCVYVCVCVCGGGGRETEGRWKNDSFNYKPALVVASVKCGGLGPYCYNC